MSTDSLTPDTAVSPLAQLWLRLRRGDSGMVPILIGTVLLAGYFEVRSSAFLTVGNLNNLFIQAAVFVLLGMAEIWLLLLGEIDLSLGFVAALSGATGVILTDTQFHWPWYSAVAVAMLLSMALGSLTGLAVIRLRLPSFIVSLALQIILLGFLLDVTDSQGVGGTISITNTFLHDLVYGQLSKIWTVVAIVATVAAIVGQSFWRNVSRKKRGLETAPTVLLGMRAFFVVVCGGVAVWLFDANRGHFIAIEGMPWAIVIVGGVLALSTFILNRTKAGRYIYAIGGNQEAARRAGIRVDAYRLLAFALAGLTAGIAGLLYVSNLNGVNNAVPGGTLVLYAVASAVIGGTSLFGGRGKMVHALIGGTIIAMIYNGMALLSTTAYMQYIATGLVLLAAVTVDKSAGRGSGSNRSMLRRLLGRRTSSSES